jgi:L-malate glycosyltransferase
MDVGAVSRHAVPMITDENERMEERGPQVDTMQLRVMHVVQKLGFGGAEVGVLKVVNGLQSRGLRASICSLRPPSALDDQLAPGVKLFQLGQQRGNSLRSVWRLYRTLLEERPHIVHTHSWSTLCEGLVAARLARVPVFVHGEHGTLDTRPRTLMVQRWAWKRADAVLSVSSRLAERIASTVDFPLDRIRVIRNGVDLDRFRPQSKALLRARLNLPVDGLVVGTIGRFVPVKDQRSLINAIALLREDGVACSAVLVGDGPLRGALQQYAADRGVASHVHFAGERRDVHEIIPAFDVFALVSISEGLSNTTMEAMASGVPVVATRVGGADELVVDGTTGRLVPPSNPEALVEALKTLLKDERLRTTFGHAARARMEQEFGLSRMISNYERLYRESWPLQGVNA